MTTKFPFRSSWATRLLGSSLSVLALTSLHHVYGALVYETPWRLHVLAVALIVGPVMVSAWSVSERARRASVRRLASGAFMLLALVLIGAIGGFEGAYNHVLKNLLFFSGGGSALMQALFPRPTYEMPNDLFFELTGILQVVPAAYAAYQLALLLRHRATITT